MKRIKMVLGAGMLVGLGAALGVGCGVEQENVGEAVGKDTPTGNSCTTARDCAVNQYCHPFEHTCYEGDDQKCSFDAQCAAGAVCHVGRCHGGGTSCNTNAECISTQYCHYGSCHAEMCSTSFDCPPGVPCIVSRHVCGLP